MEYEPGKFFIYTINKKLHVVLLIIYDVNKIKCLVYELKTDTMVDVIDRKTVY